MLFYNPCKVSIECIIYLQFPYVEPVMLELSTYIGISVALACFAVTCIVLSLTIGVGTNVNSIHFNIAMTLLVSNSVFMFGISNTEHKVHIVCTFL